MGERPKVVVDVQFQGQEAGYGAVEEQFEFALVGGRILVRPCAADHPQRAQLTSERPRKRPASPRSDPCVTHRVANPKRNAERQQRAPRPLSRTPSPTNFNAAEQQTKRRIDRSTSPCFSRKSAYEEFDERFPPTRKRPPQRAKAIRDDSNTSFSSYRGRRQPRPIRKENSMWNISKMEPDNYSMESSASLGDVNCGYCVKQDDDGNYCFTARSKNIGRMKRGRRNLAIQAGFDEDLCFKRLKQFQDRRNKNGLKQRNKQKERDMTGSQYDRFDADLYDEEPRTNVRNYRNTKDKKCMFSCHQCCSNEMAPSIMFEEFEMFASTETLRREPEKKKEGDEESIKKGKVKIKSEKKESRPPKEPEKYEEVEGKESKYKAQESKEHKKKEKKSKGKDKNKQVDKQESRKYKKSTTHPIKEEDSDNESDDSKEDEIPFKKINLQPKNRPEKKKEERQNKDQSKTQLSPENAKVKEEKKAERKSSAQSQNKLSPERGKKKEEKSEERKHSAQSQNKISPERAKKREDKKEERKISPRSLNRLSPESANQREDNKEERVTNVRMVRNCCRTSRFYKQAHFDE